MLNLPKNHKTKPFFEPDSFVSVTVLVSRKAKFENSKCCILKTRNATVPKTGKRFTFEYFFYLVWIKKSENLAALILQFDGVM